MNCYKINIKLKFGERKHDLDAVIDTGASITTKLKGNNLLLKTLMILSIIGVLVWSLY